MGVVEKSVLAFSVGGEATPKHPVRDPLEEGYTLIDLRPALAFALSALLAALTACQDQPDPRFQAPLVSGVITLPMTATQRFDERLSANGFVAALRGGKNREVVFTTLSAQLPDASGFATAPDIVLAQLAAPSFEANVLGPGVSPADALTIGGHALVVGSGFTSVANPTSPLGLLQVAGEVVSELSPLGYTRVIGVRDGSDVVVMGHADYHPGMFESAMQVGPGIVERGLLDIRPRERTRPRFVRAFVATCSDRWIVGVTQIPVHLIDLGERLLAFFEDEGLACDEVANLSGDREALLAVISDDRHSIAYFGNPTLPRASLLAFAPVAP